PIHHVQVEEFRPGLFEQFHLAVEISEVALQEGGRNDRRVLRQLVQSSLAAHGICNCLGGAVEKKLKPRSPGNRNRAASGGGRLSVSLSDLHLCEMSRDMPRSGKSRTRCPCDRCRVIDNIERRPLEQ